MNVGDKVKLTPKTGGQTVIIASITKVFENSFYVVVDGVRTINTFYADEWDIELLGKPLPTKRSAAISVDLGDGDYADYWFPELEGDWIDAAGCLLSAYKLEKYANEQGFTVLFEGID